jgi:hypothetical protein
MCTIATTRRPAIAHAHRNGKDNLTILSIWRPKMTNRTLMFVWAIIAIGIAILVTAILNWQTSNGEAWVVCLALASFASVFKVKLPKLTGTLSPGFVFLLISVATRSWTETVVLAAVSGVVQCLWRPRTRPSPLQVGFNASMMSIAAGVTYGAARWLMATGATDTLVVLGVAGVTLMVSNTLMVSTILCLLKEAPFATVWRSFEVWAVPYYLAGGTLANVWAHAQLTARTGLTIVAAVNVYLLSVCVREVCLMVGEGEKQRAIYD